MATPTTHRTNVFISYSHQDKKWLERLQVHLKPLEREGRLDRWDDTRIQPGANWREEIRGAIAAAKVAVLLISADFLASDFIATDELPPLLAAAQQDGVKILPVIVAPSLFAKTPALAQFQAVNPPNKPLAGLRRQAEQDEILVRVAEVIMDVVTDPLAPVSPVPGKCWNVPLARNPFFTGRTHILEQLLVALAHGGAVALTGLGGIGKTQIAMEYAYRQQTQYQAVLWVRADSRESLIAGFVSLAGLLDLPEKAAKEQEKVVAAVQRWLTDNKGWLLVLDNADEVELVRDYVPAPIQGSVLITTRASALGGIARPLPVTPLTPAEGALLLLRRAGLVAFDAALEDAPAAERKQAEALAEALAGLPLALDQAGAFIEETQTTLEEYLHWYRQEGRRLRAERGRLALDHPSVAVTFAPAFANVVASNRAAADLLRLSALLYPTIPEEIFTIGAPELGEVLGPVLSQPLGLVELRRDACRLSLLQRDAPHQQLLIHPVVQAVLKDEMEPALQRQWAERAVRAVNHCFPTVEFSNWPLCERLLLQALTCAMLVQEWVLLFPEAADLLNRAAVYLHHRGRYVEAEPLFRCVLAIREQALGPAHPDVATSLNNLAILYRHQGRYAEAEPLHQRALAMREQSLGPDHPDVAQSLNNLALLYVHQGRYAEAEPLYQRALATREQALGPDHPDVAQSLNNLAELYRFQGRYAEAEPLAQRALAIREQALGPAHPDVASVLDTLASLYRDQGRYAEAESLYQRALNVLENALGLDHLYVMFVLENYAALLRKMNRLDEALALEARARSIRDKLNSKQA
ncbi:MAG: tetratricopeptide repeat protein [Candidatus Competibacteraceae bacterium]